MSDLHIEPRAITRFDRTPAQLEAFVLFAYFVAGYESDTVAPRVNRLLDRHMGEGETPFSAIRRLHAAGQLAATLAAFGLHGQISRRMVGLPQLASLDAAALADMTAGDMIATLEGVFGVGPKTARFVALHSRPDVQVAVLDRHILRFLERLGHKVPKRYRTPEKGPQYARLEAAFLAAAHERRMAPAALDLSLWSEVAAS